MGYIIPKKYLLFENISHLSKYVKLRKYNLIKGVFRMNEKIMDILEAMNTNLNVLARNQAMLYCKLKDIEEALPEQEGRDDDT